MGSEAKFSLVLEVAVHREEDVESRRRQCKQLAIPEAGPAVLLNRRNFVISKVLAEAARQVLVKQDAHPAPERRELPREQL